MYNFNTYTDKHTSRYETIITLYRSFFNRTSIPNDYITLCARHTDDMGQLSVGSELYQLIEHGFLCAEQFYGVDMDEETIELNSHLSMGNWVCGDVHSYLTNNIHRLSPSVINLDTVLYSKRKASNLLSDTLLLLTDETDGECLVALNVMVNNSYETHTVSSELITKEDNDFIKELEKNYSYECAISEGKWQMHNECYLYSSTDRTVMCTYVFYRNK